MSRGILEGIFGVEFCGHSCVPGTVGRGVDADLMSPCPQLAAPELWLPALASH